MRIRKPRKREERRAKLKRVRIGEEGGRGRKSRKTEQKRNTFFEFSFRGWGRGSNAEQKGNTFLEFSRFAIIMILRIIQKVYNTACGRQEHNNFLGPLSFSVISNSSSISNQSRSHS
jgi:hypothetical protein